MLHQTPRGCVSVLSKHPWIGQESRGNAGHVLDLLWNKPQYGWSVKAPSCVLIITRRHMVLFEVHGIIVWVAAGSAKVRESAKYTGHTEVLRM
ncbi:hypothetical protein CBR_g886 [Chara braunii]|uniref:Uncharacterized protein n=1 Tax=Chara braunii TaxID=69332 RepID=A0A388KCK5_CHABU|nr:hypothetical protein CBR_g886 [Chara braunii]|eukprot:GBG67761.1 hypothetical protein CBR_g886 [Chara braunii]